MKSNHWKQPWQIACMMIFTYAEVIYDLLIFILYLFSSMVGKQAFQVLPKRLRRRGASNFPSRLPFGLRRYARYVFIITIILFVLFQKLISCDIFLGRYQE